MQLFIGSLLSQGSPWRFGIERVYLIYHGNWSNHNKVHHAKFSWSIWGFLYLHQWSRITVWWHLPLYLLCLAQIILCQSPHSQVFHIQHDWIHLYTQIYSWSRILNISRHIVRARNWTIIKILCGLFRSWFNLQQRWNVVWIRCLLQPLLKSCRQ